MRESIEMAQRILSEVGITINGSGPADIQVHNNQFYSRVFKEGSLGLGESYMDGWWDCAHLDQFFARVIPIKIGNKIKTNKNLFLKILFSTFFNLQTKKRAFMVGQKHYDLSDDLFKVMLDSRMNYTCAYWKNAQILEEAQLNKLELTCQKLLLEPGMRLLDIGCGWGALARYAAEKYGVSVVGITISKNQATYAKKICAGLPVDIRFQDYRDLNEKFDRIVSLGMFEHVGHLNYRNYMNTVHRCLNPGGLFLLHTIGSNQSYLTANKWITKYIFPNGMLPSIAQIGKAYENLFVMEDWHNFGADYDKTLMCWYQNFNAGWPQLKTYYDDRFYRMWTYYLLSCAGCFRARSMQLWQIVFSKNGIPGGYTIKRPYFQAIRNYSLSI